MDNSPKILGGLFESCPLTKAATDCPFIKIRKMTIDQQIDMVELMTNEELEKLLEKHKTCLTGRMEHDKGFRIIRTEKCVTICPI